MTSNEPVRLSNIIAPAFQTLHLQIKAENPDEVWCAGGRGSTKSSYISIIIFLLLTADSEGHAVIGRKYDNELRETVFGQMQWAAFILRIDHIWKFTTKPMRAVNTDTGQQIIFKGADNPKKMKSINLGKGYIKIFWGEEVDQFGGMEDIRNLMQSVFRGKGGKRIAFYSFNPPKSKRSWVNQEIQIIKPGRIVHRSDYRDVPADWLGEKFLADAEHLKKVNEMAYRHEYLGEETGTGLEVFNNVKVKEITDEDIATFGQTSQGLDFGYAADPLAWGKMYFDAKKRRLWIFKEISGIGIGNRKFAGLMSKADANEMTIADNAEPKSIDELRNDYNIRIKGCTKGAGSVEHGIKWLSELEEIIIDPIRCPRAAKEFTNYALDMNRAGEVVSKYPDKDNHMIDMTRYALQDEIRANKYIKVGNTSARSLGL